LPRLRTFSAFVASIALAASLAACGGGGGSDDPQSIVDEATFQGVESGQVDLSVGVDVKGEKSGHVDVDLSGSFNSEEDAELPDLDMNATAKGAVGGEEVDFDGGLTLLEDKAYVAYEGTEYEVDPTTYDFIKSTAKQRGAQGQGSSSEVTACQEAAAELEVAKFVDHLSNDGSADVGGTSTTKVSGDLNATGAVEAVSELLDDPVCSEQLKAAGPVPSQAELDKAKSTLQESIKSAHIELYVGDDHIVRRMLVKTEIDSPTGSDSGAKQVDLDIDLTLTGVNEDQAISAPKSAKPLSDLFLKLGINPIELLGALQGGGVGDLGGLLEGLSQAGGGSSGGSGGSSGGGQQAYYECLGEANTPVDIQHCTGLLQ
jgi:hypothetical protein